MSTPNRDRDEQGRARNARPRDAYGRPMPYEAAGVDRPPEDASLPPAEALAEAQRLLDTDRPFHAHEILEGAWKEAPEGERELWRGLAQVAVGLTHAQRGNARGAVSLLRRGAERVADYAGAAPHEIAATGVADYAYGLADRVEGTGLDGVEAADRRVDLTAKT